MKILKVIVFLFIFSCISPSYSKECQISISPVIIKADYSSSLVNKNNSNCSNESISRINEVLNNSEGILNLKDLISLNEKDEIKVQTNQLTIFNLSSLIKKEFALKESSFPQNIKLILPKNYIYLEPNDSFILECFQCNHFTDNKFTIKINDKQIIWGTFEIQEEIEAYTPIKNVPYYTALQSEDFIKVKIKTKDPSAYIQDLDNISYYKTNKNLPANTPVKLIDLSAINLIQIGQKVDVIISSNGINVNTKGIARKSGYLNETIEIQNISSQRKFSAKVIDFNKVKVEL